MLVAGLWIAGTGVVALSFEYVGAAVVFFGIAGLFQTRIVSLIGQQPGAARA
jgi:hypothetical protein